MACSSCKNRQSLFKRTMKNVVRTISSNRTTQVSVESLNDSTCNIKVRMTAKGYIAECLTHGTKGEPASVPDQAKVECKKQ